MVIVDKQTDRNQAMTFNIDTAKSYATEKNLAKAVADTFGDVNFFTVCNRQGRFVALFPAGWNKDLPIGHIIHNGFMVIG
jgi:hypothetical protein